LILNLRSLFNGRLRAKLKDQVRNCQQYAARAGAKVLSEWIVCDKALSGSGSDRPGLQRLYQATLNAAPPFNTILIDDTSRLSRNQADVLRLLEHLRFSNIRVIAVSQGIDSFHEQSDLLFTFHGVTDSLYIKELTFKTHRGLKGMALNGYHTGGRCFGYRNVKEGDRVRLEVDPQEAKIIQRIFELYAGGVSLKNIARRLNKEGVPPPRTARNKHASSWCYTAIRAMLRRELYRGKQVWNQRRYVRRPGTNKRIARLRPRSEWIHSEDPKLRIISEDLWNRVHSQREQKAAMYPGTRPGLLRRTASS